jgi:hypothetical protein
MTCEYRSRVMPMLECPSRSSGAGGKSLSRIKQIAFASVSVASNLLAEWEFGDCFGGVSDSCATQKTANGADIYLVGEALRRGGG